MQRRMVPTSVRFSHLLSIRRRHAHEAMKGFVMFLRPLCAYA
jgi:hypothetical protein